MKLKKITQLILVSILGASFSSVAMASSSVEFSGAVEASITESDDHNPATANTHFTVDKVELGITGNVNNTVSAEVVLLAENFGAEGEDNSFGVDTALIHINTLAGTLSAGKTEFALASGETNMISGSRSGYSGYGVNHSGFGISLSGEAGILGYSIYVADPDADTTATPAEAQNTVSFGDLMGLTASISPIENITLSAGYTSRDGIRGTSIATLAKFAGFGFIAEITDIEGEVKERTNFEISYGFNFGTIATGVQEDEAGNNFQLVSFGTKIYENTVLKFEYKSEDKAIQTARDVSTLTLQLAYNF